jgi:5'-3' exonuclease
LGSDYTEGINGIGIVNSLEILQAFSMHLESGKTGIEMGLNNFKTWLESYDPVECIEDMCQKRRSHVVTNRNRSKGNFYKF